jgi:hypothetical protein
MGQKSNPVTRHGSFERRRLNMAGRRQAAMGAGCLMALALLPVTAAVALVRRVRA